MNLAPYLKFMLKLQADCLTLQANQIPRLQLLDKEKEIGKKTTKTSSINKLINDSLNSSQKQELLENKTVYSSYSNEIGTFIIQIEKKIDDYILKITPKNITAVNTNKKENNSQQLAASIALLRITLGIIILVAWYKNITSRIYSADGMIGYFDWLFDSENGNDSSFTFYKTILDTIVVPIADNFSIFMLVAEFAIGLGLLLGAFTRFFSLLSILLFFNFFLSHIGGLEWIWSYVLLVMTSLVIFLGYAGRKWGIDAQLLKWHGEPRYPILW